MTEVLDLRSTKCEYIGEYCASYRSSTQLMKKYLKEWVKQTVQIAKTNIFFLSLR